MADGAQQAARHPFHCGFLAGCLHRVEGEHQRRQALRQRDQLGGLLHAFQLQKRPEVQLGDAEAQDEAGDVGELEVVGATDDGVGDDAASGGLELRHAFLHLGEAAGGAGDLVVERGGVGMDGDEELGDASRDEARGVVAVAQPPGVGLDAHRLKPPLRGGQSGDLREVGPQGDLSTGEDGTAVHGKTDQDMP